EGDPNHHRCVQLHEDSSLVRPNSTQIERARAIRSEAPAIGPSCRALRVPEADVTLATPTPSSITVRSQCPASGAAHLGYARWEHGLTDTSEPASGVKADLETLVSLAKRRGFVFPSAEIYGGFAAAYDYGPLGAQMRRNIRDLWWRAMVQERDDIVGIEAAIITNPQVWVASGHVSNFTDPLVECRECQGRFRADHLEGDECP